VPTSTAEVSEAADVAPRVGRGPSARGWAAWSTDWPLTLLVVGFPIWWALGLASIMPVLMALPMALHLYRRHPVRMPDGFGWWLIFLACVGLSVAMLFVDAPGAVPGGGPTRLIVFGYRFAWYLACGIVLLWVANLDERELPTRRVVRLLSWMFVVTVLGGLLGVLVPNLEFTSAVEAVLPGGLRSNSFVRSLVHPASAAVQSILGTESPRPIAPFAFANSWGANLSMFLPFFLVGWLGRDAGWRRSVAPVVLVVAAVPIVLSLNRGLWLSLALGVVYAVVRLVLRGRLVALVGAVIVVAVAGVVFVASPLGEMTANRLETPHSNDRRGELLTATITSTAEGSPILGFGSTRDVQGSFASIAGGATPECPACTVPPLGTQGQLWLVLFSQGFVGLFAFLAFFGGQLARHWRSRTTIEAVGVCLLLFFALQLFVYDTLGMPMYTVMIAIGLMWRERTRLSPRSWSGVTLESTASRLRGSGRLLIVSVVLGALAGGFLATRWTPTYEATAPVLLQASPVYLDPLATDAVREITVDTEASMVYSEETIARVRDEFDLGDEPDLRESVRVTAPPNTRVLRITVVGDDPDRAAALADALAVSYLEVRDEYLEQRREQVRRQLEDQLAASAGLGLVESVETEDDSGAPVGEVLVEEELRRQLADLELGSSGAGRLLRPAQTERVRAPIEVPVVSGALIGGLLGLAAMAFRDAGRRRRPATRSES
jgi:O-antigen ligase